MYSVHANAVEALKFFFSSCGAVVRVVYYPGSGTDTTPSNRFPGARIIYLDISPEEVASLVVLGHEAYVGDAQTYSLSAPADVVYIWNSPTPGNLECCLCSSGFVVCNDWWKTASNLYQDSRFVHVARIDIAPRSDIATLYTDQYDLKRYWETVETDNELRAGGSFDYFRKVVERQTETTPASVVDAYKELLLTKPQGVLIELPKKQGNRSTSLFFFRWRF